MCRGNVGVFVIWWLDGVPNKSACACASGGRNWSCSCICSGIFFFLLLLNRMEVAWCGVGKDYTARAELGSSVLFTERQEEQGKSKRNIHFHVVNNDIYLHRHRCYCYYCIKKKERIRKCGYGE
uniref:Uncharacterized protein n=1 Tax=Trypanosoma vivax (strain Y486) TaxID=1055687 RepID=G0U310_TRYVY|nr:hypothetical protein TVY486_0904860 [Trypanosoma vivax Y486]